MKAALKSRLRKGNKTSTYAWHEAPEAVGSVNLREHFFELLGWEGWIAFRRKVYAAVAHFDTDYELSLGIIPGYLLEQKGRNHRGMDNMNDTNSRFC